jgi:ABC-2 type transport system permease protein
MEIHFARPVAAEAFSKVPGVRDVEAHGDTLRLTVAGPLDAIVKAAGRFEVVDLASHEPSLEDVSWRSTERVGMMSAELAPGGVMVRTVFTKTLRDQRRALMWWSLGFVLTVFMYAAFWPNVHANASQFNQYIDKFPEAIRNMLGGANFGTPEGYVQTELFSLLGPILLLVYAIGAGARAIAGEEEAGTLDLLLSTPVRRRRLLLDKFGSMVIATLFLAVLTAVSLMVLGPLYDLHLSLRGLTAATLNLFLLALGFGAVALAAGTVTGSKGAAIGASSGLAVVTFILNTLAPSVAALRPFRLLSPFHYYLGHELLTKEFSGIDVLVLVGISAVALVTALGAFERRDLAS